MTLNMVWLVLRVVLGVAAGLWLGLKISPLMRKMVTRITPMRQRLQENFLRRLGFTAGILTVLLAGGVAVLIFEGLGSLGMGQMPKAGKSVKVSSGNPLKPSLKTEVIAPVDTHKTELPPAPIRPLPPIPEPQLQGDCYLQVGAFEVLSNAQQCAQSWRGKVKLGVIIGQAAGPPAPYKVLIGPFDSFAAVKNFRRQQGIEGFSRQSHDLSPLH